MEYFEGSNFSIDTLCSQTQVYAFWHGQLALGIICERIPSNIMCFWKRVVRSIIVRAEAKRSASVANGERKRNVSLPRPQYMYCCLGKRSETFRFQQPIEEGSETSRFQQPMGEGSETSRFHAQNICIVVWVKEAKRFASNNQWRKEAKRLASNNQWGKEAKRLASNNQWGKEAKRLASTPTIYVLLFG